MTDGKRETGKGYAVSRVIVAILVLAALVLPGCVAVPIPWPGKDLTAPDTIEKIGEGSSTREEVASLLGTGDLIRRYHDRYWVYGWTKESGKWVGLILGGYGTLVTPIVGGPVVSTNVVLCLQFDEKGILVSKQFGVEVAKGKYCTPEGVCIEKSSIGLYWNNQENMFTVNGFHKESITWPQPGSDQCVVVLWPNAEDWKELNGIRLDVGDPPQGSPKRIPVGSYLTMNLPAGQQTARVSRRWLIANAVDSAESFLCEPGQAMYIEIKRVSKGVNWKDPITISLKPIDPEIGRKIIAEMPRVLPPDEFPSSEETEEKRPN